MANISLAHICKLIYVFSFVFLEILTGKNGQKQCNPVFCLMSTKKKGGGVLFLAHSGGFNIVCHNSNQFPNPEGQI